MSEDSKLLKKQLKINDDRLRKLEEHKKSVELHIKNLKPENDPNFLLETLKRLDRNLQFENKQREGILRAMRPKTDF